MAFHKVLPEQRQTLKLSNFLLFSGGIPYRMKLFMVAVVLFSLAGMKHQNFLDSYSFHMHSSTGNADGLTIRLRVYKMYISVFEFVLLLNFK